MKRRLLALLLVLAMLLPMIPMGTLAEDWEEDVPGEQETTEFTFSATASMTSGGKDGVEVMAVGNFPASEGAPVYVVAAYYDETGKMVDADYTEYDGSSGMAFVHLYNTPEDAPIYVYVLNKDLQPVTTDRFRAQWEYGGWYGEYGGIYWSYADGILDLNSYFGSEEMAEGDYPWSRFAYETTELRISGLAEIAAGAFRNFKNLKTINFWPNEWVSLSHIGTAAFYGVEKAEVITDDDFDWTHLTIDPGNDIIEKARPATDEPVEDVPALNEQEATEPTQATEETVQETTEEPAAAEKPVEQPKEEPAKEPEEELTSEEAASEGYYVAPEGAQLQEDAELEELAAFTGTDKTAKGRHTASFTGLVPYESYTFLVSAAPGSLEDLKYIGFARSNEDGDATVTYIPKDESKAIVQLYGPEKLTLAVEKDYVTLQPGEKAQIRLISNGKPEISWDCDDSAYEALNFGFDEEDNTLCTISIEDDFQEKLKDVQTQYVTFYAYEDGQLASVKIRVDLVPGDSRITDATLGETTVTHNYYSSEATAIPVFLGIEVPKPEEEPVDAFAAFDAAEEKNDFIQAVTFSEDTPQDVKDAFEIRVQDDHTLLLSTKMPEKTAEYADGNDINLGNKAKSLKSSYNVGFELTIKDQEEQLPVTGTLKLNVQKKLPTLKAATVNLNTYAQTSGLVEITGGEIERIENVTGSTQVGLVFNEDNGTVTAQLQEVPTKSSTQNLTAQVVVKGYNQPVTVKVPVKIDAKTPTLKLGKTSLNLYSIEYVQEEIPVLCTTKGIAVEDLEFGSIRIQDSKGNELDGYNANIYNGTLNLYNYAENRPVGKQDLVIKANIEAYYQVGEEEWSTVATPVSFKLTVNNVEPSVKLDNVHLSMM